MEITNNLIQTVQPSANVAFIDTPVEGNCAIIHRVGSGLVTIRGTTQQCRARYRVVFGGNVAITTGGDVAPVIFALSINGEGIRTTTMISTPAAVGEYNNISSSVFVDVPRGCCYDIGVKNIGTGAADVQNANLIIERVA